MLLLIFQAWILEHAKGSLNAVTNPSRKRIRLSEYIEVEKKMVEYLELRRERFITDKCGLSWLILQDRAAKFADETLSPEDRECFKISPGWIRNVLNRNNFINVKLAGEAGDVNPLEAEASMRKFRSEVTDRILCASVVCI